MREFLFLGMCSAIMAGCTCAAPIGGPDARSPDVIDPLEPCALGIRRTSMDLMPLEVVEGTRHMAFAGGRDRLWVAQTDGPASAPIARLTELGLDGTRLSVREIALPPGSASLIPMAVGEGEPREVLYFDSRGRAVIVRFEGPGEAFVPPLSERVIGIYTAVAAGPRGFVAIGEVIAGDGFGRALFAMDQERVTTVELPLDVLGGLGPGFGQDLHRQWSLTPPDASGRILGAVVREGGDLMAMTIDTAPATPLVSFIETGVNLPATFARVRVARGSGGAVIATYFGMAGPNLRAVWLDEGLRVAATADLPADARWVELFGVTAAERALFAFGADGVSGVRELRVAAGVAPGELSGGRRALGVGMDSADIGSDFYAWSPIEGSMSLAMMRGGLEVVTLCAPL
jgi:hypothetical protein